MIILGISAYYHDSSAALIIDGKVVVGALEERFSRVKHDKSFPSKACIFCVDYANIKARDIDEIVFYEKPFMKFERIIKSHIDYAPYGLKMFLKTIPIWLKFKLNMRKTIRKELLLCLGCKYRDIKFVEHHLTHACNAFFQSGFKEAGILVIDAVGENSTTSIYKGTNNSIELIQHQNFPNSLGLLYSAFTYFLGFRVNSDEYKVMGLAPYGKATDEQTDKFIKTIKDKLVTIYDDGAIKLKTDFFEFMYNDRMVKINKWSKLFNISYRTPGSKILQSHMNLAYAIQFITNDIVSKLVNTTNELTGYSNICLAGGCAMNCVSNGELLKNKRNNQIYIPFAPDDSGCSIGAAMASFYIGSNNLVVKNDSTFLGPNYSDDEILASIEKEGLIYTKKNDDDLFDCVTSELINGQIIGWFQGRMEFGSRALGNRSILADARLRDMKDRINSNIKFRESFRPFAPVVLDKYADKVFDLCNSTNKHMSFTYHVKQNDYPSVTHIDNTARVQILSKEYNEKLYLLIEAFYNKTNCPLLLNTSFNVMGEPIVCSPIDAIKTFKASGINKLVIGNFIISK